MNEDNLEIPAFLKRNKDGTLRAAEHALCAALIEPGLKLIEDVLEGWESWPSSGPIPVAWLSVEGLEKALNDPQRTLIERQPIYMELRAREDKVKAYKRLAEMKAKKEVKNACKNTKT